MCLRSDYSDCLLTSFDIGLRRTALLLYCPVEAPQNDDFRLSLHLTVGGPNSDSSRLSPHSLPNIDCFLGPGLQPPALGAALLCLCILGRVVADSSFVQNLILEWCMPEKNEGSSVSRGDDYINYDWVRAAEGRVRKALHGWLPEGQLRGEMLKRHT